MFPWHPLDKKKSIGELELQEDEFSLVLLQNQIIKLLDIFNLTVFNFIVNYDCETNNSIIKKPEAQRLAEIN